MRVTRIHNSRILSSQVDTFDRLCGAHVLYDALVPGMCGQEGDSEHRATDLTTVNKKQVLPPTPCVKVQF